MGSAAGVCYHEPGLLKAGYGREWPWSDNPVIGATRYQLPIREERHASDRA